MASLGGPVLLTPPTELASSIEDHLCANTGRISRAELFDGPIALSNELQATVDARIRGTGC